MYNVSLLWSSIEATPSHRYENSVTIGNTQPDNGYQDDVLVAVSAQRRAFPGEEPSVGGCLAAELTVSMLAPSATIPRMAKVTPWIRVTDGSRVSEWIPQGVYFIDTRETTQNSDGLPVLSIHAFDGMLKTEADWPSTSHAWPATDLQMVQDVAAAIGCGIDPRTVALLGRFSYGLPAGYSMREALGYIGAAYGGNWIMNYDGDLLLITVAGLPPETNYLVDENGNAITFGGDRILV